MKKNDTITRQEAIDALKAIKIGLWEIDIPHPGNCPEYIEHHKQIQEMIGVVGNWIERIKALPATEPTEEQVKEYCRRRNLALIASEDMKTIRQLFLPAEPRKGKWIKGIGENGVNTSLYCDQCGYENGHWYEWNFCPHCGARMEESE